MQSQTMRAYLKYFKTKQQHKTFQWDLQVSTQEYHVYRDENSSADPLLNASTELLTERLVGERRKKLISNKTWHLLKSGEEVWYFPEQWLGEQWQMCWYHSTISNLVGSDASTTQHTRAKGLPGWYPDTNCVCLPWADHLPELLLPPRHPKICTSFIPKGLDERGFSMAGGNKSCSPARAQQEGRETKRTSCCLPRQSPKPHCLWNGITLAAFFPPSAVRKMKW